MNSFFLPNTDIIQSRSSEDGQFKVLMDLHKQGVTLDDPSKEKKSAVLDSMVQSPNQHKIQTVKMNKDKTTMSSLSCKIKEIDIIAILLYTRNSIEQQPSIDTEKGITDYLKVDINFLTKKLTEKEVIVDLSLDLSCFIDAFENTGM